MPKGAELRVPVHPVELVDEHHVVRCVNVAVGDLSLFPFSCNVLIGVNVVESPLTVKLPTVELAFVPATIRELSTSMNKFTGVPGSGSF